jgi:acetolactate synthase-1/2/3 large subunit
MTGLRTSKASEVDDILKEMIAIDGPVIADVQIDPTENCFPMIPSGAAHNEMLLGPNDKADNPVSEEGMVLV